MPNSSKFINPPCPSLTELATHLPITHTRPHRNSCSTDYHTACLELAQSLWRCGSPAQAILQLDKSFMANDTVSNIPHHSTYSSILWIILHSPEDQFLGNPVRHFQHLASRMNMSQPNAELRIWRAWTCLHITESHTSSEQYPRDTHQLEKENLIIPSIEETISKIQNLASQHEAEAIKALLS